jgi:hypothetical protein
MGIVQVVVIAVVRDERRDLAARYRAHKIRYDMDMGKQAA